MLNPEAYDSLELENKDQETIKKETIEMLEILSAADAHFMLDAVMALIKAIEGKTP